MLKGFCGYAWYHSLTDDLFCSFFDCLRLPRLALSFRYAVLFDRAAARWIHSKHNNQRYSLEYIEIGSKVGVHYQRCPVWGTFDPTPFETYHATKRVTTSLVGGRFIMWRIFDRSIFEWSIHAYQHVQTWMESLELCYYRMGNVEDASSINNQKKQRSKLAVEVIPKQYCGHFGVHCYQTWCIYC